MILNLLFWCMVIIICLLIILFWQRWRFRKMLNRLSQMLVKAKEGTFNEANYDESILSSIESQMKEYLATSVSSTEQMAHEKEEIKRLISDISHQTKTPVTNLLLYSQLLAEQADLSTENQKYLTQISQQTEKLNFLITTLIKLSRLETGILALHPQKTAILPMLKEVQLQFNENAQQKNIQIILENTQEEAIFDQKWTTEALANIVENAIKYTADDGKITIKTTAYEFFCRIDITDTGIGISEKELAQIFTRFYRSSSVADNEGVGIGLYLTRQILAAENAYLKVDSKLEEGSTFSVFLVK
ncbi:sensor histidine kinase [Enterococcus sp. AZ103]|uniref:sensor histidine kinase n=1 Tax=Enterococcus sp. AZ103 TaxID=2774628 RepID=UPI003F682A0F